MNNNDPLNKARALADAVEKDLSNIDEEVDWRPKVSDALTAFYRADRAHSLELPWEMRVDLDNAASGAIDGGGFYAYDALNKMRGAFNTKADALAVCEAMNKGIKS